MKVSLRDIQTIEGLELTELQRVNSWIKLQNNLNKAFQNGDFALLEKINNIMEVYNNEK